MAYQIAINGFGRIGRMTLRSALTMPEVEVVAINDLAQKDVLAYLFKHDTAYRSWGGEVSVDGDDLLVDDYAIPLLCEPDPKKLPWKKLDVDVVLECSGAFTDPKKADMHLKAGAKAVIISAPAKGESAVPTGVIGVNELAATLKSRIFSNASCTTNCIAPVMAVLEKQFGVDMAMMTTAHAYTADQTLQDGPHKDFRRARAAGANIVPTTTGAAITTTEVIPSLRGKFDGLALRVPVITGSVADITALLKQDVTIESVNDTFIRESDKGDLKGILKVSDEPLVSSDIIGSSYSAVVDLGLTSVVKKRLVKVVAWYDNERGYSQRLIEQAVKVARQVA